MNTKCQACGQMTMKITVAGWGSCSNCGVRDRPLPILPDIDIEPVKSPFRHRCHCPLQDLLVQGCKCKGF